jgi:hypothetical protein
MTQTMAATATTMMMIHKIVMCFSLIGVEA